MVSLVDIAFVPDEVEMPGGQKVEVNGLTASHIVGIMLQFPEVRKILAEREADLQMLVTQFPVVVGMIIAAGTNKDGDQATIDAAMKLGVGLQYEFIEKIWNLSFPKGVKSFLDGVRAAMRVAGVPGWDQAMKLPVQSSPTSGPVGQSETAGTAPPGSSSPGAS